MIEISQYMQCASSFETDLERNVPNINLSFNLRVVKMADEPKRSMRVRHASKFHNAEEEEAENYATMANPTYRMEVRQTTVPINVLAKLLAKFLNQANQDYRESKKDTKKQKKDRVQKPNQESIKPSLRTGSEQEPPCKATIPTRKDADHRQLGKLRQLYSFKASGPSSDMIQNKPPFPSDSYPMMGQGNLSVPLALQNHMYLAHQLNQLQEIYPGIKEHMASNPSWLMTNGTTLPAAVQQQLIMSQMIQARSGGQTSPGIRANANDALCFKNTPKEISDGKLFKRSSYHVAIAYHIYLKNLPTVATDSNNILDLDPTFHARRLREEKTQEPSKVNVAQVSHEAP